MATAALVAGILALIAIALAAVQTEWGRDVVIRTLTRVVTASTGLTIRIDGLEPGMPVRLGFDRLTVADADGIWLSIDAFDFSWRPAQLLAGTLAITNLSAERIAVARLPAAGAPEQAATEPGPMKLPSVPVDIRLDRLSIGTLALAAPVIGQPAAFTAHGRLGATAGEAIESELSIRRIDGGSLQAEASARLSPATSRLLLDLRLEDGADGLVATLAGIDHAPPFLLTLAGDGPLDTWNGRLDLTLTEQAIVAADVRLRGEGGRRIQVEGGGSWHRKPPEIIPAIIRPAIADGFTFSADVDRGEGGPIEIEAVNLQAKDLGVTAKGRVDPDADRLDLTLGAAVGSAALAREAMGGFGLKSAGAQVTASGSLSAPEVRGNGVVDGVRGPDLGIGKIEWTASARPAADDGGQDLRITVTVQQIDLADAKLRAVIGPKVDLAAAASLNATQSSLQLQDLVLQAAAARLNGKGIVALGDADSKLDLVLAADDLSRFSPLADMPLAGRGRIAATVTGPLTQGKLAAAIDAEVTDFTTQDALVQAALGSRLTATADVRFDQASGLAVPRFRFAGRTVEANGAAGLSADFATLHASLEADVRDLRPLAAVAGADAAGRIHVTASASGPVADPAATVVVQLADGRVADVDVRNGRIEVTAKTLGSRPTGQLRVDASTSEGPIDLAAAFAQPSAETLEVRDLRANLLGVRTEGSLAVGLASGLITGRLVGGLPASGVPQARPLLRGDTTFEIGLKPDRQAQTIDLRLRGASLRVAGDGVDAASIDTLRLDATVADALRTPRISARARVSGVRFAAEGPFEARFDVNGPLAQLVLALTVTGPKEGLSAADVHGQVDAAGETLKADIAQLTARMGAYRLALRRPTTIISGSGRLAVNDLDVAIGDGALRGRLDLRPGSTLMVINAEGLPLGLVKPWAAGLPSGHLSMQADLRGSGADVAGQFAANVDDLRLAEGRAAKAAKGRASVRGTLGGGVLDADGDVSIDGGVTAAFSGRLPVKVPPGKLAAQVPANAALVAQAKVDADLALLTKALGLADQRLAGRLAGDFRAGGTLDRPEVIGSAVLGGGLYENFVTGTLLTPIDGRVDVAAGDIVTVALTAQTKGGGSIVVDGQAALAAHDGPAINLAVTAKQARLVQRDDVTAATDATLRYQGGLTRGVLAGRIDPTSIEVRLLDRLPPNVVVLPVTEVNRPGGEKWKEAERGGTPWVADLDIAIDMPRRVFVRGRGLESEWSGRLHVGGTTDMPQLIGSIDVARGVFTFASKRFALQKGTITFTGGQPIDPVLDIAATYQTADLTAVIGVTGTANDPKLGVTSQPPLPQSEVLAQVLFGKSSSRLGPVEAIQLAAALDSLARGESWSEDVLGSVRQFLGLDVLNLDTSGSGSGSGNGSSEGGGASVEAGRYVTEGVYVGAKQGLTDSTTGGRVEVEITPGISLQSDLTQNAEGMSGSIGLRWKHDY